MGKRTFHPFAATLVAVGVILASGALATPEPAAWRRQTLMGENSGHFFRYVTTSVHPGFYYSYSRTLRLEKVRKSDFQVVETVPLRDVAYSQDIDSGRWSQDSAPVPAFDLSGFLRRNQVCLAFADDLFRYRTFAIDSAGVREVFEDGRIQLATRNELERQIPRLGEDPRVVGIESTGPGCEDGEVGDFYLRIWSNGTDWEEDWSEDLLLVRGVELR